VSPALPDIQAVVPHRPPMLLLSRLLAADGDCLQAEAQVDANGPFGNGLQVPAWVGIEYMAQAVAAWAGLRSLRAGGGARLGFLLGTRRYRANVAAFEHGQCLQVEVRCELLGDNGLGAFSCRLVEAAATLAEAQLSVYEPADAFAYLQETP
jgi:predicted hotdog family 3-hydroxylacyl-ACP dehydratase